MIGETFDDYLDEHGNIKIPSNQTMIDLVDKHSAAQGMSSPTVMSTIRGNAMVSTSS